VPNLLTVSRLIAAPFIGYCILHGHHGWALGLFAYAGVTDLLDGWIARKWNSGTVVGTIIDPLADKTLMTVLTVTLAMQGSLPGEFPSLCLCPLYFTPCQLTSVNVKSLASSHHPRPRRRPGHIRHLLQVDLSPAS
jgi:phosphatidylglycerophosphate synthase